MSFDIKIALTNLGKYNEGELVYKWVELPIDDEDFEEALKSIGIDGIRYEEYFISDYESDLDISIGEYANIKNLNEMAEMLQNVKDYDEDVLKAILEEKCGCSTPSKEDIEEAINIVNNGDYIFLDGVTNAQEMGEYIVSNGLFRYEIPEELANYIDYETIGDEYEMDYSYVRGGAICLY